MAIKAEWALFWPIVDYPYSTIRSIIISDLLSLSSFMNWKKEKEKVKSGVKEDNPCI